MVEVYCARCGRAYPLNQPLQRCPHCRGLIFFRYPQLTEITWNEQPRSLWRFHELLPVPPDAELVTLDEGNTPLIRSRLGEEVNLFWKAEFLNPTGSIKDRAMTVGLSMAKYLGFRVAMNASTGSAGLATAAYSARAGMRCVIAVPADAALERVAPILTHGATVFALDGTIQDALDFIEEACQKFHGFESTTHRPNNPYQNEGTKTIAFELWEQLGRAPDWVIVPRGSGGSLSAIWRGFQELKAMGRCRSIPHMAAAEVGHLNALQQALAKGLATEEELRQLARTLDESIPTVAVKLAHAFAVDGEEALVAIRDSEGTALGLSDDEIMAALNQIARSDGLLPEPSSAITFAAYLRLREKGQIRPGETVVAVLTGSGFRELPVINRFQPPKLPCLSLRQAWRKLEQVLAG
jgi:threonine synthase